MPITLTTYPTEPFNSYASLAYFKARLDVQLRVWAGKTDDQMSSALIAATEYMDVRHGYVGYPKVAGQSRQWPREEAYDCRGDKVTGIHVALQNACCEYAWRHLNGLDLMPDPTADEFGQVVKSKDEKVGPIATSIEYETSRGTRLPVYPKADSILYAAGLVVRRSGLTIGTVGRA
jgi:hypothetical protein